MPARPPGLRLACACALALAGCILDSDPDPVFVPPAVVADGSVVFRWSVQGTFDPNQCVVTGAPTLRIRIFFVGGGLQGEYVAPCVDFAASVVLSPGTYTAEAFLEGPAGPRTTAVAVDPFTVFAGSTLTLDLDFPGVSFF